MMFNKSHRLYALTVAIVTVGLVASTTEIASARQEKPNIVVI